MMNQKVSRRNVLVEALWPQASVLREIVFVLAGSWLVALTAQIHIPLWPVPITGQTFGVLVVGALLGSKRGAISLLAYLGQGAAGLPFFAQGSAGFASLLGPTGGYLVGMVMAAFVVGWLCEHGWDRRFVSAILAMLIGTVCIYFFGLVWLAYFVGWSSVLSAGLLPFIPGDLLKLVLAALVLPWGWTLLRALGSGAEQV